ncbi:MAG: helix-turn-helix transcriptional regulator [Pseudomonadota bacterium]
MMIRFGSMSIVLLLAALYGVMRAVMLCCAPVNRAANRILAALILALALYTFPYIVGYAGYYDAYPWLSYFPYNLALAIGPLFYLYMACLNSGAESMPPRWGLHLAPALAQLLYYSTMFVQPLAFKNSWDAAVHVPLIDPVENLCVLLSLGFYWTLAWRAHAGAGEPPQAEWKRNVLITFGLTLGAWLLLGAAELASAGLNYFQRFPFYLWLAIAIAYLGAEGYRQALVQVPAPAAPPPAEPPVLFENIGLPVPPAPTQAELGQRWRAMVIEGQWWRDPELSLASLAQKIGTNTTALSRAMNEGLGLNFNEMINRLRVDAVVAALQQADENQAILDIALAEGFNSKASFNRSFKLYTGKTPRDYRPPRAAPVRVSE